jgi:DNA-binding response OmpR family regulator
VVSAESSAIVRSGDLEIDTARHVVSLANRPIPLTPVEFRILEYLAVNHDRVLSRDEIIESCLGEEATVMERTIDAHIAGIRRALGSAAQYVQTIRTIGYTFSTNQ